MAYRGIRLVPLDTRFDFVRRRFSAFAVTGLLFAVTIGSLLVQGLNFGIDFNGGTLIEIEAPQPVDVGPLRERLSGLDLGEVSIQQFGSPRNVLIRVQAQDTDDLNRAAVNKIRAALGEGYDYRRVEQVGPKVGSELLQDGLIATALAILGIGVYVYFRFEWQFAVAALIATLHDVVVTVGLFSVLQLEFDLTAIAALLTLAGYSVNDTVVVFDRIREVLRRRKSFDLPTIINESVNSTLSRTTLTGLTTLLAIVPLLLFGGSTLFNFSLAMIWGILIGTYSSIFVASSLLLYMPAVSKATVKDERAAEAGAAPR